MMLQLPQAVEIPLPFNTPGNDWVELIATIFVAFLAWWRGRNGGGK